MARFNSGDEDAFAELVALYRKKVFSIALGHMRNNADADEITQDAFIRVYSGLKQFRGDASFATWLRRIVFNLSRNRCKYYHRRRQHLALSLDCILSLDNPTRLSDLIASDAPSPAQQVALREYSQCVENCMEELRDEQIEILKMRGTLQKSYSEIGSALRLRVGTVKSRIGRAREKLRFLLSKAYPDLPLDSSLLGWLGASRPLERNSPALGPEIL